MTRHRRHRSAAALSIVAALVLVPGAVGAESEWEGPIVILTLGSLRADAVSAWGGSVPTPVLDGLIEEADWAGTGVAASSFGPAAIGSILTGQPPWIHGSVDPGAPRLNWKAHTLAEHVRATGGTAGAFLADEWFSLGFGFDQGFDRFSHSNRTGSLRRWIADLPDSLSLTWVHLGLPRLPYVRRDAAPAQRDTLEAADLAPHLGGRRPLSGQQRRHLQSLYGANVAAADALLGRVLGNLNRAGRRHEALLIVTSDTGEALGEEGRIAHGWSVSAEETEVPLLVLLPDSLRDSIRLPAGSTTPTQAIAAWILEAMGTPMEPGFSWPSEAESLTVTSRFFLDGAHLLAVRGPSGGLRFECRFRPSSESFWPAVEASIVGEDDDAWGDLRRRDGVRWLEATACDPAASTWTREGSPSSAEESRLRAALLAAVDDLTEPARRRLLPKPSGVDDETAVGLRRRGFPVRDDWLEP